MPDEINTSDATRQADVSREVISKAIKAGKIKARKVNPDVTNSPYQIERKSFLAWVAERIKKKNKRAQDQKP